jgi:hypothetical protein
MWSSDWHIPPLDKEHFLYLDIIFLQRASFSTKDFRSFNIWSCKPPLSSSILPSFFTVYYSSLTFSAFNYFVLVSQFYLSSVCFHLSLQTLLPPLSLTATTQSAVLFQICSPNLLQFHILLPLRHSVVYATIRQCYRTSRILVLSTPCQ